VPEPPASDRSVSDTELLQRHLQGEAGAFEALVKRYRRELFNFLYRFTGDAALAEDVFQEALLQLHLSGAAFDPARRLRPWLFTIAANKARDALRSRGRRRAAPLDAPVAADAEGRTRYADLMPADVPAPDESLMNLETRQVVQGIVDEMPEHLRMVLVLCYFHEMAYKDIAEVLEVPLGTVKSRIHAAVRHFARKWQAAAGKGDHGREQTSG
jgi:RNA polymerase sigma-70 factor (ECF subfamily)